MAKLLEIKLYGCDILKEIAEPVKEMTSELQSFIEDMIFTMYYSEGIGLAAPQVGLKKRIIVCDCEYSKTGQKNPLIIINPEFTEYSGEFLAEEGCLSIPNIFADVVRFKYITLKYFDQELKEQIISAEDVFATVIQHEYDHLNGVLFIDKVNSLKKMSFGFKLNRILEKGKLMSQEPVYKDIKENK